MSGTNRKRHCVKFNFKLEIQVWAVEFDELDSKQHGKGQEAIQEGSDAAEPIRPCDEGPIR